MKMLYEDNGDGFYAGDTCAIYRWYPALVLRAGTYRVIALNAAFDLMKFYNGGHSEEHPTCVVDDFGSLVKVPA